MTNVPTLAERTGDFSQSKPLIPPIDPFTRAPFPGCKIPAQRIDPIAAAIAALYPAPNRNVPKQNYVSSPCERSRDDHFDMRLDHACRPTSQLTFRYSFGDQRLFEPFTGPGFAWFRATATTFPAARRMSCSPKRMSSRRRC